MNELEGKKPDREPPDGVTAILGIAAALIMLVIILAVLNRVVAWGFGWSVGSGT